MKIIAVIPAHMSSIRLPKKILLKLHGLEMIEHVRRRVINSKLFEEVIVATGDKEISDIVQLYGGKVYLTKEKHYTGTSRVAEAVKSIDASHIVIVQGDEPLLMPCHLEKMVKSISKNPNLDSWNATSGLTSIEQLNKKSFVKCIIGNNKKILYCFRRSPSYANEEIQLSYIRKIMGLIAYRKEVLMELNQKKESFIEKTEFIEQLKIISYGYNLFSVNVEPELPSINVPGDKEIVLKYISDNAIQQKLLHQTLTFENKF